MSIATINQCFTSAECEMIINKFVTDDAFSSCTVQQTNGKFHVNESIRKVTSLAISKEEPENHWVIDRLLQCVNLVKDHYQMDLEDSISESINLLRYQPGGHYNWHKDNGEGRIKSRQLSLVVQLSDPATYNGAETQFQLQDVVIAPKARGEAIAFPSSYLHRVSELGNGIRYCLVTWLHQKQK